MLVEPSKDSKKKLAATKDAVPQKRMSKQEKKLLKKRLKSQKEVEERDLEDEEEEEEKEVLIPPRKNQKGLLDVPEDPEDGEEVELDEFLFKPDSSGKAKNSSKVIDVDFELVLPNEAYYHSVRALLNQYLDGEENEQLDVSGLSDQVVSTVSIGSVVASPLEQDPAEMPEYRHLPDDQFDRVALRFNKERDVYGFITVLSVSKRQKTVKCFQ